MENFIEEQSMLHNEKINNIVYAPNTLADLKEEDAPFFHEFQCSICLDLLYKPVVLACGHLSCFWCVFRAMDASCESYCPICRHPYNHFPSVCQLLHFLLLKMYPNVYSRREMQVGEEETKVGSFSPQLDSTLFRPNEIYLHSPIYSKGKLSSEGSPFVENNSSTTINNLQEESTKGESKTKEIYLATSRISEDTMNGSNKMGSSNEEELEIGTSKQPSIFDLLCVGCNKLLLRPVALNCGHVYCEACIVVPEEGYPRCQICQSFHPNRSSSVCLVLEHFITNCFSEAYAKRREKLLKEGILCTGQSSSDVKPSISTASWFLDNESEIHFGYGCDSCGMTPILGRRYRCKDCVEKIGYDLCETCYKSPAKIFGRFNQQHRPDHAFELMEPQNIDEMLKLNLWYSSNENLNASEYNEE